MKFKAGDRVTLKEDCAQTRQKFHIDEDGRLNGVVMGGSTPRLFVFGEWWVDVRWNGGVFRCHPMSGLILNNGLDGLDRAMSRLEEERN